MESHGVLCYRGTVKRLRSMSVISVSVTHDFGEESPEEKARWYQSLPLSERMEMLCAFTDLALEVNPSLPDLKDAQPAHGPVQIIAEA